MESTQVTLYVDISSVAALRNSAYVWSLKEDNSSSALLLRRNAVVWYEIGEWWIFGDSHP